MHEDCMDLGSAPPAEDCAQVGREDYHPRARRECRAYIAQLRRVLGDEPPGARLVVTSNPHDFGTYLSVACRFDPTSAAAVDFALKCESAGPQEWDEAARRELSLDSSTPNPDESEPDSRKEMT